MLSVHRSGFAQSGERIVSLPPHDVVLTLSLCSESLTLAFRKGWLGDYDVWTSRDLGYEIEGDIFASVLASLASPQMHSSAEGHASLQLSRFNGVAQQLKLKSSFRFEPRSEFAATLSRTSTESTSSPPGALDGTNSFHLWG
jgi:hypothetical protein